MSEPRCGTHSEGGAHACGSHRGSHQAPVAVPLGRYFCPMCAGVQSEAPGSCPHCGMALEKTPGIDADGAEYVCPMHPQIVSAFPGSCPICGMALEPRLGFADAESAGELVAMTRRFWIAAVFAAPLLVIAMAEMLPPLRHALGGRAMRWIELVLATPAVLWSGAPLFARAWNSIVRGRPNMFTLIGLGTGAAYGYSVLATLVPGLFPAAFRDHAGNVPVYFEAAAVITALVLLGQVLELRARAQTGAAIRALLGLAPNTARRVGADGAEVDVPAGALRRRRPTARASRREDSRGRHRRGRSEHGRRVDDHRRADAGREGARATPCPAPRSTATAAS